MGRARANKAAIMTPKAPPTHREFICLMAAMVSVMALSTDIMLPALSTIGLDLKVAKPNDVQLIVSSLFLGYAAGQLFVGPLSDTLGRRPVIIGGYIIFIVGCLLSIFATNLAIMLMGRVLQGFGGAAPRIVTIAIIRDTYEGRDMARTMSFVMSVFILVPAIAPSIGQAMIAVSGWRMTFGFLLLVASLTLVWFTSRQAETLATNNRRPFSVASLAMGTKEAFQYRATLGYTLAITVVLAAFIGYLSSAQQIFKTVFEIEHLFPLIFGGTSLAMGAAFLTNAKLVMRHGMAKLVSYASLGLTLAALPLLIAWILFDASPTLMVFIIWLVITKFCVGLLFGNLNALAMQPVGHMAGLGAALIGFVSTILAIPVGWLIGWLFDGTVLPLVGGFACLGAAAVAITAFCRD